MLLDRNRVVHSRNVTYDSKSVTNPIRLLLQRTEVRANLSLSAMRLKGSLMASQPLIYQSTCLGEKAPASLKKALLLKKCLIIMVNPDPMVNADQRVNPDLSTEAPFTPDTPPEEGWPWE